MITHKEFKNLEIEEIVDDRSEIQSFGGCEFMDDIWNAKTYGFTEFLKLESDENQSQSISINFEDLRKEKIEMFLKKLGLTVFPGMTLKELENEFGEAIAVESFVEDRKTYEYIIGDNDKYYLSCTILDNIGLTYVVVMNHVKTIEGLKGS